MIERDGWNSKRLLKTEWNAMIVKKFIRKKLQSFKSQDNVGFDKQVWNGLVKI